MAIVYLALGSNLGDRSRYIIRMAEGVDRIDRTRMMRISGDWSSAPWNMDSDKEFINACVAIETSLEPTELLVRTRQVERSLGRLPSSGLADRTADIDILWWEDVEMEGPTLTLPHPGLFEREFFLRPLREVVLARHAELIAAIDKALEGMPHACRRVSTERERRNKEPRP